jgi:DNA-binding transcriptional ArsR family regulator
MSQTNGELSRDLVFEILSNPRRRFTIYYLRQRGEAVDLQELAAQVAAWENEVPVDELTKQERKRVYVSLYQTHIPKLADAGIISYDQDEGTVELTENARQVRGYLTSDGDQQFPWHLYYVGLATLSTLFLLGVALQVSALASIPLVAAGGLVIAAFALSAVGQYLYQRYSSGDIPLDSISNR